MGTHYPPNNRRARIQEDLVHKCDNGVMNKERLHGSLETDNVATCKDGSEEIRLEEGDIGKITGDDFEIKFRQTSHVIIDESGVKIEERRNNHQEISYEF